MEPAAREVNLSDIADRVQKILVEASQISSRIDEAVDALRGGGGKELANGASAPEPPGLIPMISIRLAMLERVQVDQRAALNRIHDGLRAEAPPPATAVGGSNLARIRIR